MSFVTSRQDPSELFEILAKLGEGSYGSVFKALDKRDGLIVAIKVLEMDSEDTAELQKEINILKECHSEHIVAYKGSFEKDRNIWIVMEYCGAGSLCDLMAICERTLTEDQIASVMKQSLYGLHYLHNAKKIHRDIKSGNILLTHEGDCKLADFGVSAELTTTMAKRKTVIGTPYWMAPEVLQSAEYNGKADIWSLAITAMELAVGEPPHSNIHPMRAIFLIPTSEPPTLPEPAKYSREFNDFLKVCLNKNPELRPSAEWLLKHHPFITRAKGKKLIADLVEECISDIDEYRRQEALEASKDGGEDISSLERAGTMLSQSNNETMVLRSREFGTGTMVNKGGPHFHQQDFDEDGAGDYGTMVARKPNNNTDYGTMIMNKAASAEPEYLKRAGGVNANANAKDEHKTRTGNNSNKTANIMAPTASGAYRTGKALNVTATSSLPDLQTALATLHQAHQAELAALERFYADKRRTLTALIQQKEKEQQKR